MILGVKCIGVRNHDSWCERIGINIGSDCPFAKSSAIKSENRSSFGYEI